MTWRLTTLKEWPVESDPIHRREGRCSQDGDDGGGDVDEKMQKTRLPTETEQ